MNNNFSNKPERPVWVYVLIAVIVIGLGVPLIELLGHAAASAAYIIAMALIAIVIIKLLKRKDNEKVIVSSNFETCSDIHSIDMQFGLGMFVIERGDGFRIDGDGLQSRIKDGVWYISGDIIDNIGNSKIITVTIPDNFTAEAARIKLGAGNILIKGLAAYAISLEVSAGNMEASGLYAKELNIVCGVGRVVAGTGMAGGVNISCGVGEVELTLTNREEEFNIGASVGLGKVIAAGREISGMGKCASMSGAQYNMDIKCGMGSVRVDFGGAVV